MKRLILMLSGMLVFLVLIGILGCIYYDNHRVSLINPKGMSLECYMDDVVEEKDWAKGNSPYNLYMCAHKEDKDITVFILTNTKTKEQYKAVKVRGEIEINSTDYSIAAVETMFNILDKSGSPTRVCFPYPTYSTFEEWKPFAKKHEGGTDKELKEKYEFILEKDLKCRNDQI